MRDVGIELATNGFAFLFRNQRREDASDESIQWPTGKTLEKFENRSAANLFPEPNHSQKVTRKLLMTCTKLISGLLWFNLPDPGDGICGKWLTRQSWQILIKTLTHSGDGVNKIP